MGFIHFSSLLIKLFSRDTKLFLTAVATAPLPANLLLNTLPPIQLLKLLLVRNVQRIKCILLLIQHYLSLLCCNWWCISLLRPCPCIILMVRVINWNQEAKQEVFNQSYKFQMTPLGFRGGTRTHICIKVISRHHVHVSL